MAKKNERKTRKPGQWGSVLEIRGRPGWHVRFTHEGKVYQRSAGFAWATANSKLRKVRVLLEVGTPLPEVLSNIFGDVNGAALTFRKAAESYLAYAATRKKESTLRNDTHRLRLLCKASWAGKRLGAIRSEDLNSWVAERQKSRQIQRKRARRPGETLAEYRRAKDRVKTETVPGASGATLNRDLACASAVFRWAVRASYVDENPVKRVERFSEKGRAREVYLTAAEAGALLEECCETLRPVVLMALHTGMRRGELLALRWRAVDLERRQLVVEPETEKTGRGRVIALTDSALAELGSLRGARPRPALDGSDHVFTKEDGRPLTASRLRKLREAAVATCEGIAHSKRGTVNFHTLRHTAASLMVGAGVPLFDVGKILGHTTPAVTMRYAHFAPEAGRSAIEELGRALSAS